MRKLLLLLTLTITLPIVRSYATTWDEPWAEQVIKGSTSFVLAKIVTSNDDSVTIRIIKTLGGQTLADSLVITDFYLLSICSTSGGHGPEFNIQPIDSCYFFIKQNKEGKYCIATPSTGFDYVWEGQVKATFRHSFHQAFVPLPVYEKAMTAIFNKHHGQPYNEPYINSFIQEQLSKKPAGFGEDERSTFFLQHVALECIYHLKPQTDERLLFPFLNDSANFHNQLSAARALSACNTTGSKQELLKVIGDSTRRGFIQVMCIESLAYLQPKDLKSNLEALEKHASEESDGFGGNIMDPRICTWVPSPKEALAALIKKL